MSWTPVSVGELAIVVFTVLCAFRMPGVRPWPGWRAFGRRFLLSYLLPVFAFGLAVFFLTWAVTGRMPPVWSLTAS